MSLRAVKLFFFLRSCIQKSRLQAFIACQRKITGLFGRDLFHLDLGLVSGITASLFTKELWGRDLIEVWWNNPTKLILLVIVYS